MTWYLWLDFLVIISTSIQYLLIFVNCCIWTHITTFVKNPKHPSSVTTMKLFQICFNTFQFCNYNILYLLCWSRGKSDLPLLPPPVWHTGYTNLGHHHRSLKNYPFILLFSLFLSTGTPVDKDNSRSLFPPRYGVERLHHRSLDGHIYS